MLRDMGIPIGVNYQSLQVCMKIMKFVTIVVGFKFQSIMGSENYQFGFNHGLGYLIFFITVLCYRIAKMWKELQTSLDELP